MKQPNQAPKTFATCMEELMESRGLSATRLSQMLGYKSKTALLRILQGKAGMRSVANIQEDLCQCQELALTDREKEELREAGQIAQLGMDRYRALSEMHRLLLREDRPAQPLLLYTTGGGRISLSDFLGQFVLYKADSMPEAPDRIVIDRLELLLCGGCYLSVMQALTKRMEQLGKAVSAKHIFRLNKDTAHTVRLVRNIVPIVGQNRYEAFVTYDENVLGDLIYQTSTTGQALLVRAHLPGGGTREFQILLQNKDSGVLLEASGIWEVWSQYTAPYWEHAEPIIAPLPCVKDYVSFITYVAVTEKDREMLLFKGDFCMCMIPTDILYHAIEDSAAEITASCDELSDIIGSLDKLRSLHEKRFWNISVKKQPTHWIASASALWQFARTGVQRDHFFAMRPFTAEERLRIFRVLVKLCKENPSFHFYLIPAGEEQSYISLEAIYYGGIGFQLNPIDSHYNLSRGWNETMFTEPAFCSLYRDFYLHDLLPHHTRPHDETMAVLEEIIAALEQGELA